MDERETLGDGYRGLWSRVGAAPSVTLPRVARCLAAHGAAVYVGYCNNPPAAQAVVDAVPAVPPPRRDCGAS